MPIKIDCPRCKKALSVPTKMAGAYVNCPNCTGRLWIPDDAPRDTSPTGAAAPNTISLATSAPPTAPGPIATVQPSGSVQPPLSPPGPVPLAAVSPSTGPTSSIPPPVAGRAAGPVPVPPMAVSISSPPPPARVPPAVIPVVAPSSVAASPPPVASAAPQSAIPSAAWARNLPSTPAAIPPAAMPPAVVPPAMAPVVAPGRKVAKMVTTDAAQSPLKLAEDGRLPELHLGETDKGSVKESSRKGMNPLVLLGLLALSMVASFVMVLSPTEPAAPPKTVAKEQARQLLEQDFFRDMDSPGPVKLYHYQLRAAKQAHVRGNFERERQMYRAVLDQLRAERVKYDKGVTGSLDRDQELEKLLMILLSD